jgi:hypothetical protein
MLYAADMVQSTADIPPDISRLTVPEAARGLGISPEAVRNRLSRGTLRSVKEDGTVYVLLETDRLRYTDDTPNDIPDEPTALISAKDETIRVLREQLEAERAASAELRRIVAGLVQRVPELEPAREPTPEPRESPVTSSREQGNSSHPRSRRSAPGFTGSSSGHEISGEVLGIATPMVDIFRRGSPTGAGMYSDLLYLAPKIQSCAAAANA